MRDEAWKLKWKWVLGYWLLQAVAVYFVCATLWANATTVDGPAGKWLGDLRRSDLLDCLTNTEYIFWIIGVSLAIPILQLLFLLPVRKPGRGGPSRWPVWVSVCVAGLLIGAMTIALAWALWNMTSATISWPQYSKNLFWYVTAGSLLLGWIVATPLLWKFACAGERESALSRLSARLFLGTIVEVAAIIPLDIMIRRKETCHCWALTYWALLLAGAVGLVVLGPAIFLPALARRRRRWYGGHCDACGYDMSAIMHADRCPECGTGWKPSRTTPDPTCA